MQPVQDLTVEDRVSRTQYQYTLEDPDLNELNQWTTRLMEKLNQLPQIQRRGDGPADQRAFGGAGDRSSDGFAHGNYADQHRSDAVRRIRAAAGVDAVHATEPVSRDPGDAAGVSEDAVEAAGHLRAFGAGADGVDDGIGVGEQRGYFVDRVGRARARLHRALRRRSRGRARDRRIQRR